MRGYKLLNEGVTVKQFQNVGMSHSQFQNGGIKLLNKGMSVINEEIWGLGGGKIQQCHNFK